MKTAPRLRLDNERRILDQFGGRSMFRRLIDEIHDPPFLVLEHLDDDLLKASNTKTLNRTKLKDVAGRLLRAIELLHENRYTHTDVKPDNVLVDYREGPNRFSDVVLNDFGETCQIDPADKSDGTAIGASIFPSPEATPNLRWGPPTDIWSFGATMISLIFGEDYHSFRPEGAQVGDEDYDVLLFLNQVELFWPFEQKFQEIADPARLEIVTMAIKHVGEKENRRWFCRAQDKELLPGDREFICEIMRLDPRDRPTAKELSGDEWLERVD